jgi:hypothetical protein
MHQPPRTPYTNERIVYRTSRDVLTDQRLIADGNTYPLKMIKSVKVASAPYFMPLMVVRVVALIIAVIYVGEALGWIKIIGEPEQRYVKMALALVFGGFGYAVTWIVPTVSLTLILLNGTKVRAMWSNDRRGLAYVVDEIRGLLGQQQ